eukprot:3426994-Alexandrium_andersonii.AAC.1
MRMRRAWPRAAAAGRRRPGGAPERRLWTATAAAFQPHAPSAPHSTTASPGSSGSLAIGRVASR